MDSVNEPLDRESIVAGLSAESRRWMKEVVVHAEIDSTNTHLMSRSASEEIDGVVCIAERQTHGRGRRGRTWLTPPFRSIALSLGKRVSVPVADVSPLSLVVGLAVSNAMDRCGIDGISLKWPNDVLLDGVKVGGVLIELAAIVQPLIVVAGVGINMGGSSVVSAHLGHPVGDVRAKNRTISRNDLVAELINGIYELTMKFELAGFSGMRREWESRHAHQDCRVRVIGANETIEGTARGVTVTGELVLETATGTRHFSSGEVSLRGEHV